MSTQHHQDVAQHAPAFASALGGVLANQKSGSGFDVGEQIDATKAAVLPAVTAAVGTGAGRVADAAGVDAGDPDDDLAGALAWTFANTFTNTTSDQLGALGGDDDPDDVFGARLAAVDDTSDTVISGAINAGSQVFANGLDPDQRPQKTWDVGDDNPCPDCDIDGETVGADDDFSNGAPHGPMHSNCTCSVDWTPAENRSARKATRMADKYSADDMKDLLDKGKAMKNANGDPSYPVADQEDIEKAIKAVGRGGADHDDIRAHIIKGAKALDLMKLIPDNWNADGSLKDAEAKSRKFAPETREQRAEDSLSFGDIQSRVYEALIGTLPGRADIWIVDLGIDWVVYQDYWMDGMYRVSYSMDAGGLVSLNDQPVRVDQVTSFVPVEQKDGGLVGERRDDADVCSRCDGKKTVMLNGNSVECPQCGGDGTGDNNATETKSRSRRRQRRDLPRQGERRLFTATIEMRGQMEGDEAVLRGTPIVFESPYQVRDMLGTFRETMKPTVIDNVLRSKSLDCRFLENHDGRPLARTTNGTLTLTRDDAGVQAEARVDTRRTDSRDLMLAIERQDITQMSCGFMVADDGDEWRVGDDGVEERDIHEFGELFDVSAVTYPASPTTSIELAMRGLFGVQDQTKERLRRAWVIAKEIREGKVLSQQNGQELMEALEALHQADDEDIPGIVRSLQTINTALDKGQASLSSVLGRANPDGDAGDLQPTLTSPDEETAKRAIQRQRLLVIRARDELLATRELLAV